MTPDLVARLEAIDVFREWFTYDADSGLLCWKIKPRKGVQVGALVGTPDGKGRLRFEFKGKSYPVHVVAFAMHYGRWPTHQVDHKNQIKTDNRIDNLREATNAQNSRNRSRVFGASGFRGVTLHRGSYIARIMVDGKAHHLGSFDTALDAARAYDSAAVVMHGDFASTNGA